MNNNSKIVLGTVFLLLMIGIVMIYSSSAVYAYSQTGDSMYFVKRHVACLAGGVIAAIVCMSIPIKAIAKNSKWIMLFLITLLVLVLIPGIGSEAGGARRWIRFLGIGIQPSELVKFALVLYLADLTARKKYLMQNFKYGILAPMIVIGVTAALVLIEPDMGTAVAILVAGVVMLFVSGVKLKHLSYVAVGAIPVVGAAILMEPYRIRRILTFINPWNDAKGAGFQLVQSFIALGSGGFWGAGLGMSRQKLFYLPASHTDFIFSIIGEELGFLGTVGILTLFALFLWFSLRICFKLHDTFASRAVMGISIIIAFEVIVNIGVSTGMLPTKGLPLPFISYGGSSLISHLAACGLILNLARGVE
ncbi:MAG: putative lipid II flippase FtsW [Candidatus Omnitrophica bacterium]|nr:putative lipid II flippase FtsW [Candidatus Omnitrophota bacterium]